MSGKERGLSVDELRKAASQHSSAGGTEIPAAVRGNIGAGFAENRSVSGVQEPQKDKLRQETVDGLNALTQTQREERKRAEQEALRKEEQEMAAREAEAQEENAAVAQRDTLLALRSAMADNPWLDPRVREAQERMIAEIPNNQITPDKVFFHRGRQIVPITEDYHVVYQQILVSDDLICKQILKDYLGELNDLFELVSDMLKLAVSVDSLGGTPMPPLLDPATNKATRQTIWARLEQILELPTQLIGILSISYNWYDIRVRRQMLPSSLKNG